MICLRYQLPFGTYSKPLARIYRETYQFVPPSTAYGSCLSLVGEMNRAAHAGVKLAFAYNGTPVKFKTLRRITPTVYGGSTKLKDNKRIGGVMVKVKDSETHVGPEIVESVYDLDLIVSVDSSEEQTPITLEKRIINAMRYPDTVQRSGVLTLGTSDDGVNHLDLVEDEKLFTQGKNNFTMLELSELGSIDLPIIADHVTHFGTKYRRYRMSKDPASFERLLANMVTVA